MKQNKSAYTLVVLALALLFMSTALAAPTLTFTFKDVKAPGATQTDAYAINDKSVIAGSYDDSSAVQHGMILNGTKLTTIDNPNCQTTGNTVGSTAAFGINTAGEVAGWCFSTKTGLAIAWVYSKGKFTTIAYPKAPQTIATGINDSGSVVGLYVDNSGNAQAFQYVNKKYSTITIKGTTNAQAWSINNAGDVTVMTGTSYSSGALVPPLVSYLVSGKKQTKVADPNEGSDGTAIHAVNNKGVVDGTYYTSSGTTSGFLLYNGKYYDVQDPNGTTATRADGLNASLDISGRYTNSTTGATVGFEATTKQ